MNAQQIAALAAVYLEGWSVETKSKDPDDPWRENHAVLIRDSLHPIKARLTFQTGAYTLPGTVEVYACQPKNDRGVGLPRELTDSIRLSATKSGLQIANDIRRRLLPGYLEEFEKCLEEIANLERCEAESKRIAKEVAKESGSIKEPWNRNRNGNWNFYVPFGSGHVTPYEEPTVSLELSGLAPHIAKEICAILRKYDRGEDT